MPRLRDRPWPRQRPTRSRAGGRPSPAVPVADRNTWTPNGPFVIDAGTSYDLAGPTQRPGAGNGRSRLTRFAFAAAPTPEARCPATRSMNGHRSPSGRPRSHSVGARRTRALVQAGRARRGLRPLGTHRRPASPRPRHAHGNEASIPTSTSPGRRRTPMSNGLSPNGPLTSTTSTQLSTVPAPWISVML
jgi:hypothetical protein